MDSTPDIDYEVPGLKILHRQPSHNTCWAASYCMMRCWKWAASYAIEQAVQKVTSSVEPHDRYVRMFLADQGLPVQTATEFTRDAGLRVGPYGNLLDEGWLELLKNHGLLWISQTLGPMHGGRHSRIVAGLRRKKRDYKYKLIDPALGEYVDMDGEEFHRLYERAGGGVDPHAQIRHF